MTDDKGNLLTNQKAIEDRAIQVFTDRLKPNKMAEHLKPLEETENKLCQIRLKLSKHVITEPWTLADLEKVFKDLETDKS